MEKKLTENLEEKRIDNNEKIEIEVERIKLPKLRTGVMAGICCLHDTDIAR